MSRYILEFILRVQDVPAQTIINSISGLGRDFNVSESQGAVVKGKDFKITIDTEDPTLVFDACAQFGRIKTVKISDKGRC